MLKKIFFTALMVTLIFSQNVSAEEVFVCEIDGYSYYVDTETFVNKTEYRDNRAFDVTAIIHNYGRKLELPFSFWENDGLIWFSNGEGTGIHPVDGFENAKNIWEFGLKFLGIDYEVSYK